MSKRKGLSLEEKREKVLEVFTESADVFVLKVRCRGVAGAHNSRTICGHTPQEPAQLL